MLKIFCDRCENEITGVYNTINIDTLKMDFANKNYQSPVPLETLFTIDHLCDSCFQKVISLIGVYTGKLKKPDNENGSETDIQCEICHKYFSKDEIHMERGLIYCANCKALGGKQDY